MDKDTIEFIEENLFNPEFSRTISKDEEIELNRLKYINQQQILQTRGQLLKDGHQNNIDVGILYEQSKNKAFQFGHISTIFGQYFEDRELAMSRLTKGKSVFFEKKKLSREELYERDLAERSLSKKEIQEKRKAEKEALEKTSFEKKRGFIQLFQGINEVSDGIRTYAALLDKDENELLKHFTLFERIYLGILDTKEYAGIIHGEDPALFIMDGLKVDNFYWATHFERKDVIAPLFNQLGLENGNRQTAYQTWIQKTRRLSLSKKLSDARIQDKEIGNPYINFKRSLEILIRKDLI